jgi:hypothetical protein
MMMDFSNLNFNKSMLNDLQQINPYEIMSKIGLSQSDTDKILQGDMSPVSKTEPFVVDYDSLKNFYTNCFNDALIKYYFLKIKNREELSSEEKEVYQEAIDEFFKLVFNTAVDGLFEIEGENCVLFKINGYYFVLSSPLNYAYWIENPNQSS